MGALIITGLLLLFKFSFIQCYGEGAPPDACYAMTPNHEDAEPQTGPNPYKVIVDKKNVTVGTPIEITLTSKSGQDEFKGFLIQVRMNVTLQPLSERSFGDFEASDEQTQILPCFSTPKNAITHKSPTAKKMVMTKWTPQHPGKYRIFTTVAKDYTTFWANVPHEEIIEVVEEEGSSTENYDWSTLCSDMILKPGLAPHVGSSDTYQMKISPVKTGKGDEDNHGGDPHKIHQKGLMWINVTSDYDTPILKLFMQVRREGATSKSPMASGKFVVKANPSPEEKLQYKLVNCFGGIENAVLFTNLAHKIAKVSDAFVKWEAPSNETGKFQVFTTLMSEEDYFWSEVGDDPEARKITVVKGPSSAPSTSKGDTVTVDDEHAHHHHHSPSSGKPQSATGPSKNKEKGNKNASSAKDSSLGTLPLAVLFLFSVLV